MPSLWITASAIARRAGRVACSAITRSTCPAVQPERATTRCTCVAALQSTTRMRWQRARQALDSVSNGTSKTTTPDPRAAPALAPTAAACRLASAPIIGCRMASSDCLAPGSANTRLRICARSSAPSGPATAAPKRWRNAGIAAPPGAVSAWAMASVSTSVAPWPASRAATVLLPLPMPPVSPSVNGTALASQPRPQPVEPRAEEQRRCAAAGQIGPERYRHIAAVAARHDQEDAHHRAHR